MEIQPMASITYLREQHADGSGVTDDRAIMASTPAIVAALVRSPMFTTMGVSLGAVAETYYQEIMGDPMTVAALDSLVRCLGPVVRRADSKVRPGPVDIRPIGDHDRLFSYDEAEASIDLRRSQYGVADEDDLTARIEDAIDETYLSHGE